MARILQRLYVALILLLLCLPCAATPPQTQTIRACDDDLPLGGQLIVRGELPLGTILVKLRDCNEPNYLRCVEYQLIVTQDGAITLEAFDGELSAFKTIVFKPDCWDNIPGDIDSDGVVGPSDAVALRDAWSPSPYSRCADLNRDGIISPSDAVILTQNWKGN